MTAETCRILEEACAYKSKADENKGDDSDDDEVYCDDEDEDDDDDVYQEFEEFDFSQLPDTKSIVSDDSFYPLDHSVTFQRSPTPEDPEPLSFFMACCSNNSIIVKIMIRQGVTEKEVREVDKNNRTGLIVACYQGYVDVVIALSQCPYMDVNWQDNEGNTALMTAAQAGHIMITNYLLNYFAGLDIERRNCHGFTAIMKAALQGRPDCVRALMMSGADVGVRDYGRKLTPFEWALFTGRYKTVRMMQKLAARPCAEQFCDSFLMEWPLLQVLVGQAQKPQPCWRWLSECIGSTFTLGMKTEPCDEGVLDYMVCMTTALASPFVGTACSTVCPGSPPCVGKHRPAVTDILRHNEKRLEELKGLKNERLKNHKQLFHNCVPRMSKIHAERRISLQLPALATSVVMASSVALCRTSMLPLNMIRRRSVCPGIVVPKVRLCKAPPPTYTPENICRSKNLHYLQVPTWKYKALKEEGEKKEQNKKLKLPIIWRR